MNIIFSTVLMNYLYVSITLILFSLLIFVVFKIIKNLNYSKITNDLILKELKDISSKLNKKD